MHLSLLVLALHHREDELDRVAIGVVWSVVYRSDLEQLEYMLYISALVDREVVHEHA